MLKCAYYLEDKGDGMDAETGLPEEDLLLQDEIYKSRLSSIKRVSLLCLGHTCFMFHIDMSSFWRCYDFVGGRSSSP